MIKSKSVFEFRGRHEVLDAGGQVIGMLGEKAFGKSLLRSHWYVRDPQGEVLLEAHEASWIIALVRRFSRHRLRLGRRCSARCRSTSSCAAGEAGRISTSKRLPGKFREPGLRPRAHARGAPGSTGGSLPLSRSGSTRCKTADSRHFSSSAAV